MIRVGLITAAFFSLTISLFVIQPGPDPRAPVAPDAVDVSRAGVDFGAPGVQAVEQTAVRPDDSDALGFGLMDDLAPEPAAGPAHSRSSDGLLAGLENASMQGSRIQAATGSQRPELELMVIRALKQGQSEDYIDALVNHAASAGTVEVPRGLIAVDGRVDTGALLSSLGPEVAGPGPGSEYEVKAGDSLASIAYRFYGTTSMKNEIFDANQDRLSSPATIRAGLTIVLSAK